MSVESTSLWYVLCMDGISRNSKSILIINIGLILGLITQFLSYFLLKEKAMIIFPLHAFTPPVNIVVFDIIIDHMGLQN